MYGSEKVKNKYRVNISVIHVWRIYTITFYLPVFTADTFCYVLMALAALWAIIPRRPMPYIIPSIYCL